MDVKNRVTFTYNGGKITPLLFKSNVATTGRFTSSFVRYFVNTNRQASIARAPSRGWRETGQFQLAASCLAGNGIIFILCPSFTAVTENNVRRF